ncbi:MAG: CDP-glycerol glycerophosphotransferase family protein [Melioribacteraceae bacterium]
MFKKKIRKISLEVNSKILKVISLLIPKKKNLVLFGGFGGRRFGDNSAILFQYVVDNKSNVEIYWMYNSEEAAKQVAEVGGVPLSRRSLKGIWKSLRANLIVTSHGIKDAILFEPLFHKPKLLYLNHAVPIKKGWLGIKDIDKHSIRLDKFRIKCTNYTITSSEYSVHQQNEYLPIGKEKTKITGLPRCDVLFPKEHPKSLQKIVDERNLDKYEFIVLYAPTWRKWTTTKFFPFPDFDISKMSKTLEENNICVALRPHHVDLNNISNQNFWLKIKSYSNFELLTHTVCPEVDNLLRITDCLVTDYSSVLYDFLLLDRPVMIIPYDFEDYNRRVGLLVPLEEVLVGPQPKTQKEFLQNIIDMKNGSDLFKKQREKLKNKMFKYQDGNNSERVYKIIEELIK